MLQIANQATSETAAVNATQAVRTATESTLYQQVVAEAGRNSSASTDSIYETSTFSLASCTVSTDSVNVVLEVTSGSGSVQVVFAEGPSLTEVSNVSVEAVGFRNPVPGIWSGWPFDTPGSPAYGAWYVPTIGVPSGTPNCGTGSHNVCAMSLWVGQTNQPGGGGTAPQIAQAGTEQAIFCNQTLWWYNCATVYWAWYQFFPQTTSVTCSNVTVSPGDLVYGLSAYNATSKKYSLFIADASQSGSGHDCSALSPSNFSKASPQYGNYIAESPAYGGGNPTIPAFVNVTFEMADPLNHTYPGGINDMLGLSRGPAWTNNTLLGVGTPFYGHAVRPGNCVSYTCYNITYT